MNNARTMAVTLPSLLFAGVFAALVLALYAPFAHAEEATTTTPSSSVTVAPEKLEKELKAFVEKGTNMRDKRAVAMKIKQVERRIAELKKHVERYEGLLQRLKAAEGTASSTRGSIDKREKLKEKASSTRAVKTSVLGVSTSNDDELKKHVIDLATQVRDLLAARNSSPKLISEQSLGITAQGVGSGTAQAAPSGS
ncbi:hypothetical protein K2Q16_03750 [Patescibacteria group bacterium]|nr:hypothetical protein [Patescibacteria group bacterium]